MLKSILLSATLVAGMSTLAFGAADMSDHPMTHYHHLHRHHHHHVLANGRCNGVSYGTGQRSCGTATGGTPGGNPSRN